ncbi:MAG: acetylxylan esterase [Acidobacteria bacterium]|nr:acetylxylan esterase [Acidobacteriota bacterium]
MAVSALAAGVTRAQQAPYRDYSRCLPDYLRHVAAECLKRREEAIAKLTNATAIRERQRWVRATFWQLCGGEPERTPLNVRVTGSFERERYRVEKLVYESRPGFFVPANLYLPKTGAPPYPGVLFQMGHSRNGKAAAAYQKCCQGLVQIGFVVLAFDPMGQGERTYYPRADGVLTRLRSPDDEHTVPGQQLLLVGDSSTRLQAWDAVRSLDVLASYPLVDAKRLASTGNSGGGTLTMFLAAVDDRLAAAAPSCPNSENFVCDDFSPPGSTDDAEQNFPGSGPLGFDRWDLLYPLAPKPLLVLVSAKDSFGTYSPSYMTSGRREFRKLAGVYRVLGTQTRLRWWESLLPHGLNYAERIEIYNWFRRWLQDAGEPLTEEPPVAPEKDETLWATGKGSVVRSLSSKRPLDLVEAPAIVSGDWKALLGMDEPPVRPRRISLGKSVSEGCDIEALEVFSAQHVWAPCWLYRPRTSSGTMIVLDPAGRNARWGEGDLYHELARRGRTVCAPDLRGTGDLTPEAGRGAPRYTLRHASEHDYAWASLILGRSLLGQRVTDLITVVRAMEGPVRVAALGKMTVPAIFAAAIEPRIERVLLAGGLASYRDLLGQEEYTEPFANFLPRILLCTDLPHLIDPARVTRVPAGEWTAERLSAL